MKLLTIFAFALLLLTSFATAISGPNEKPEDKIVGQWRGVGMASDIVWPIEKDHTWRMGNDLGTWSYQEGKFYIRSNDSPKVHTIATIDAKGQLVSTSADHPDDKDYEETWVRDVKKSASVSSLSEKNRPSVKSLAGEWRFAYTRKSLFSFAPAFDRITFLDGGKVQTSSTLIAQQFTGDYTIAGDNLKLTGLGPKHVASNLICHLEDNGQTLVLTPTGSTAEYSANWVLYRPQRFLPNNLAGKWTSPVDMNLTREMELRPDGRITFAIIDRNGKPVKADHHQHFDYYRLWSSPFGPAMTTVMVVPELGLQARSMKYERKNGELTIIPLECGMIEELQLLEQGKEIWKLKKPQ
jgi:hypothetical protein